MMSEPDRALVLEAVATGSLQIQMSRIAALRANSDRVRQYAVNLVEDQSKARRKLKEIALSRNVKISDPLDMTRAQRLVALQRYTGDEFDREYLTQQVHQHQYALQLFRNAAQLSGVDELRDFAQFNMSALEARLKLAQLLADSR